jgi:hypothetical protein
MLTHHTWYIGPFHQISKLMDEMLQDLNAFATTHQDPVSITGGYWSRHNCTSVCKAGQKLGFRGLLLHAAQLKRWCMRWLVIVPGLCCSCGKNCAIVDCCGWAAEVNTERSSRDTYKDLQLCIEILNEVLQISKSEILQIVCCEE